MKRKEKELGPIFDLSSIEKPRLQSGLPLEGPKTPNVARKIPPTQKSYDLQSPECRTNEKNKRKKTESSLKALKTTQDGDRTQSASSKRKTAIGQ